MASLPGLAARGVKIMGPSSWQFVKAENKTGEIVLSTYATTAKEVGLDIVTWSFERSEPLEDGGGYYYESVSNLLNDDGGEYTVIDVVVQAGRWTQNVCRLGCHGDLFCPLFRLEIGQPGKLDYGSSSLSKSPCVSYRSTRSYGTLCQTAIKNAIAYGP